MNLKEVSFDKSEKRYPYDDRFVYRSLSQSIYQWLPSEAYEFIIICIGTDRSTGDSLGPLTGTLLNKWKHSHFTVYGTLEDPVHAVNLKEQLHKIKSKHKNPYIIAIDACLGRKDSVGMITTGIGSIRPGAALQKDLPPVGNIYLTGIVNINGYMDYMVLQSTRLHLVMNMAETIAKSLHHLHHYLSYPTMERKKIETI
ncbi:MULTISPECIES: spore protease YyaC [Paraliobacillus]|uniref:spore protease YyaC n=1 Tax=Paraliobacillus TaxID=200903 RepID=UPI000DD2F0A7|nr:MULTISPECIES: spore protease YyaC [Paraliobacillus]